jgi:2TM domain
MSTRSHVEETRQWKWAEKRVVQARRLRLRAAAFALAMVVLTPVWAVSQYLESGGWPQRLSPNGNPGDWSPWIVWVALAWGFYVALSAIAVHARRPVSDGEVERELRRLTRQDRRAAQEGGSRCAPGPVRGRCWTNRRWR